MSQIHLGYIVSEAGTDSSTSLGLGSVCHVTKTVEVSDMLYQ